MKITVPILMVMITALMTTVFGIALCAIGFCMKNEEVSMKNEELKWKTQLMECDKLKEYIKTMSFDDYDKSRLINCVDMQINIMEYAIIRKLGEQEYKKLKAAK